MGTHGLVKVVRNPEYPEETLIVPNIDYGLLICIAITVLLGISNAFR